MLSARRWRRGMLVPAGQVWRIEQHAGGDPQRSADRHTHGHHLPACGEGGRAQPVHRLEQSWQRGFENAGSLCRHLDPLQDPAAGIAFDTGNLAAADVETD